MKENHDSVILPSTIGLSYITKCKLFSSLYHRLKVTDCMSLFLFSIDTKIERQRVRRNIFEGIAGQNSEINPT